MIFPRMNLHCKLVPVQFWEYEYGILLYSWRFSRYSASFHRLVHGHMTSNNETVMSGQHYESDDVKRETVHCYPVNSSLLTAVAGNGWNLSAVFKFCFCFVLLYNKSLNDWSVGEQ